MAVSFLDALEAILVTLRQPVVSDYTIFVQAFKLDKAGAYKGQSLYKQRKTLSRDKVRTLIATLQSNTIIKPDRDFGRRLYRINESADAAADTICGLADPFCYLSHLTAMQRFGLTNRMAANLIVTTPCRAQKIQDSFARISSIGATFADMLDRPALCGGMEHVLEVWQEHAPYYLDEIIAAITAFPTKLVKVRAGYIMDELLHSKDDRVTQCLSAVQRGSSQVFDPEKPFSPRFSEKWMLSLNV